MSIAARVKQLYLPLDDVIVIGSGILDTLGIRRTSDIDLAVSEKLFAELWTDPYWNQSEKYGMKFLSKDDVEIWPGWENQTGRISYEELLKSTILIDGVRFVSLDFLYDWKKWAAMSKDITDLGLIENYIKQNS